MPLEPAIVADEREEIRLRIHFRRVFVLRIWLGARLLRLALWVMGGAGEVVPLD